MLEASESSGISLPDFDEFYADFRMRFNKGFAGFLLGDGYCIAANIFENHGLITGISVEKQKRGKGLGKKVYIATEEHFYPCHTYDLFVPTDEIISRIKEMTSKFGANAVGVHIRRTDNKPAIGKSSTDAFLTSMKAELAAHPDTMFYLATDDLSEEAVLREAFPDKILSNQNRDLSRDSVNGIQDAMIDLYSLAATNKIIGSFFSSFTDIAADMNDIPKIIAGE